MELTFLGTSAGLPSTTRNVTAIVLNPQNNQTGLWLFDCGEATQHQMLRASANPGKIEKIFITHLHGDHIFGLPGLLCSRSMAGCETPLEVYGPAGIAEFIETALRLSGSWTSYPLHIHEITEGQVIDDGELIVTAYPLTHPVVCYGYRIEEHEKPGTLDAAALKAAGVTPGPLFQQLKRGETVTLEDGRKLCGADYLSAPRPGKKVAIFGDTGPTAQAEALARDVDLMVHETTLEAAMAEKANSRGHSTTHQAAALARDAGAKRLVMTHFSSRYSAADCQRLLAECQSIFPASELAEDFLTLTV
ncbi:Ribonuclease Z [Cronobacter condimenti 1330]|uniref:Ribonuclease BN n=1 Tax=Cronobacter condimenti 1330 TaxID=1073999 RepID=K7ZXW5_9ENTR|nr:ribonuclease Z [Cronobacter condimenti]ALB63429.1 ribonuclease Z [Cronobacter condimenti 1330]CCJ71283.1 Ribonuclease Z [Cronobacter condimenti 1330]